MESNNILKELFKFINQECLFYIITLDNEDQIHIKWKTMTSDDYNTQSPSLKNKIVIRLQKSKETPLYFLDVFQYHDNKTHWKGFRMEQCAHYEIHPTDKDWFDAVFYFDKKEEKLTIHHINTKIFLILQDFFSGFM